MMLTKTDTPLATTLKDVSDSLRDNTTTIANPLYNPTITLGCPETQN